MVLPELSGEFYRVENELRKSRNGAMAFETEVFLLFDRRRARDRSKHAPLLVYLGGRGFVPLCAGLLPLVYGFVCTTSPYSGASGCFRSTRNPPKMSEEATE
jgi:hypothetical protein